ncbi:MAG TPA: 7-cyano-7-deazaguanine synthase [Pirellulaceae bacterium]|nr:7-cyano-7-deazaguanine synthase [Pirellulaceae bacterium]
MNNHVATHAPASGHSNTVGVLLSGGLDSCILVATLLRASRQVQPFYVRTDVIWAAAEYNAIRRFLAAIDSPTLEDLVVFDLPLADLYGDHWSISGRQVPDEHSADAAVYLPGRNALLALKPLLWCHSQGVRELALAVLAGNPFADAQPAFLTAFSQSLALSDGGAAVNITRPFAQLSKRDVLALGRDLPLELAFSCLSPRDGQHCGRCNKCGERQTAFAALGLADPTVYAAAIQSTHPRN